MFSFWKKLSSRANTYQSQPLDFPSEPWPQNGFLVSNDLGLCALCPWGSWQTGWKPWPQNGLKTVLKRLKAFAPKRVTVSRFAGIDLRLGSRCNQILNQVAKRQISHPPKSEDWSMMFHHDSQRTISWFPFTLVYHNAMASPLVVPMSFPKVYMLATPSSYTLPQALPCFIYTR